MKRVLQFAWLLLLATTAAAAQVVSVQATVTDPNGVPYAGGTVSTSLISSQPEFLNGVQYTPTPVSGLSATGRFNLQLADNNVLQPAGSTYSMTVCSATNGTVPPFSRTPTCFTATGIAVTGVFVDLSSLLSSQSTLLNIGGISSWSQIKAVLTGTCSSSTAVFGDGSCQVPAGGAIASGTATLGTGAITSATCATVVTVTATGVLTTDVVQAGFNGDPTAVTGYIPSTSGMLTIIGYPTANNVNFKVCNNTASSITPGAITLNWRVAR